MGTEVVSWRVEAIPAFADNYFWLLSGNSRAAVVDPGDAAPVLDALAARDLPLAAILITHHHADHIGGVPRLVAQFPGISVYGPVDERITHVTRRVGEGDCVELEFLPARFQVFEVPGHTATHIAYYTCDFDRCDSEGRDFEGSGFGRLFCGDTIFACGCGRLFEGTGEQMHASLSKLRNLPGDTEVYCAHEYTLDNIAFAKWVEPANPALLARERQAQAMRRQGLPTVPSRLALECATNPFLRFDCRTVIDSASKHAGRALRTEAEVFSFVRHWKDTEFD